MAWQGDGTFTRTNGTNTGTETWQDDAAAATKIRADRHDVHDQDLSDGIAACMTQNGESKATADLSPATTTSYDLGTASLKWEDLHLNGVARIGGAILTDADSTNDIGSTGTRWANFYTDAIIATDSISLAGVALRTSVEVAQVATTSGLEAAFTSIPSWVTKIYVRLTTISTNGSDAIKIQLGEVSGGYATSGYVTFVTSMTEPDDVIVNKDTTGFPLDTDFGAGRELTGNATFVKVGTNYWVAQGHIGKDNTRSSVFHGEIELAGALDRLRLYADGTNAFDLGSIQIRYE